MTHQAHHVVIIGGGFAGLTAARKLKGVPVRVTLIDRRNCHVFQPLLYQVATGSLSPANIAAPLRNVLERQSNADVLLAEVAGFDVERRKVLLADGAAVGYDTLIVAAGVTHQYFGHDDWAELAPGLKTLDDATHIRRRVLTAFEAAARQTDAGQRATWLTFVIVGGGATGVELAGSIADLARVGLRRSFHTMDTRQARVVLVETGPRILGAFAPKLSASATKRLTRMGVTVRTDTQVTAVRADGVSLRHDGGDEELAACTVLWTAGVKGSPLGTALAGATGAAVDRSGRVVVGADLSVPGHPEIFVLGDLAHCRGGDGQPVPGLAQPAIQEGAYVARAIRGRLEGKLPPPSFHYRDKGSMATLGRGAAVAQVGGLRLSGRLAWLLWLVVHLLFIVGFRNRVLVVLQWGWSYLSNDRSAQLITGPTPELFRAEHQGVHTPRSPIPLRSPYGGIGKGVSESE